MKRIIIYNLSILGTSSDSGKSTITFFIAKLLQNRNFKVTTFKAQNFSNNSIVADDGSEIAYIQEFQNKVLNNTTSYLNNPILLKTGKKFAPNIIIKGKSKGNISIKKYYNKINKFKKIVKKSYKKLDKKYDIIINEGAGSCVELNLLKKDLSNTFIAKEFNTKIILVADIEKGGVFASIYGTLKLIDKKLRKNIIGVIINKFRGDISIFKEGIKIIENRFNIKVLGILPYNRLNLGLEDSLAIKNNYKKNPKIKIGIINFPNISNFSDFEPFLIDKEVSIEFISSNLNDYDLIILPGSKKVIKDLLWLKQTNLFNEIKKYKKTIFAICGGFEMLFKKIIDKNNIEDNIKEINGLGFINKKIKFKKKKILKKGLFYQFNYNLKGFEIRHGYSKIDYYYKNNIYGTFLHSIFENDNFRTMILKNINKNYQGFNYNTQKNIIINNWIYQNQKYIDLNYIINLLKK